MKKESDSKVFCEQLLAKLPRQLPRERIMALYGDEIERLASKVVESLSHGSAADVVVASVRDAGRTMLKLVSSAADVVVNSISALSPPLASPAFATRSLGMRSHSVSADGATRIVASKEGDGAVLRISVETEASRCDVGVWMEDSSSGRKLSPMELMVEDRESGETLLDRTCYASGEAIIRGVEPGEYWIEAWSGGQSVGMSLRVNGALK